MKSAKPKPDTDGPPADGGGNQEAGSAQARRGRNQEADFHGQMRTNQTHGSTTDPEARLYKKGAGKEARLCFMGHGLMENRNGLLLDACLTSADGHGERLAALHMIEPYADRPGAITLGSDKAYDTRDFINELRSIRVTPHVAQNTNGRRSAMRPPSRQSEPILQQPARLSCCALACPPVRRKMQYPNIYLRMAIFFSYVVVINAPS